MPILGPKLRINYEKDILVQKEFLQFSAHKNNNKVLVDLNAKKVRLLTSEKNTKFERFW